MIVMTIIALIFTVQYITQAQTLGVPTPSAVLPNIADVGWKTCDEVPVLVHPGILGDVGMQEFEAAFSIISQLTGIRFVIKGSTELVANQRWVYSGTIIPGYKYPPVFIGWVNPSQTDMFVQKALGATTANPAMVDGVRQLVTGVVEFDETQIKSSKPGFGPGITRGNLILHELGHLVGLEHTRGNLLMSPVANSKWPAGFSALEQQYLISTRTVCP
jgi:hypothetical protein